MIVADTCLVSHLFNETEFTKIAQAVLKKDSRWLLPKLWQEEYANVLSKGARKEKRDTDEVIEHFAYTVETLKGGEVSIDIQKALKLSIEYKISVYDAHFISLAIDFNISLVTEDKEILKNCPDIAVSMKDFVRH
jgi:predicted nucleic acid-binding protein